MGGETCQEFNRPTAYTHTLDRGGHAAVIVGGDGGGYPHTATEGNKEVTQTRGGDRGVAPIGAAQPATHIGAANFAGRTVIRDWSEAEFGGVGEGAAASEGKVAFEGSFI